MFLEVEKGIYNKIPIPPAIMPVPIAEAPNVKIAKSLKYANQKLEIKWVVIAWIKNSQNAHL